MNPTSFSPAPLRILVVALRTSGPDSRECSIVDLAALYLRGGSPDATFSRACDAFPGARLDEEVVARHGLIPRSGDPYADDEADAIRAFCNWGDLHTREAVICSFAPSHVRAFLLCAAERARVARPRLQPRVLDLHTLFLGHRLRLGEPIPEGGFRQREIYEAVGLDQPSLTASALDLAEAEREVAVRLLALRSERLADLPA